MLAWRYLKNRHSDSCRAWRNVEHVKREKISSLKKGVSSARDLESRAVARHASRSCALHGELDRSSWRRLRRFRLQTWSRIWSRMLHFVLQVLRPSFIPLCDVQIVHRKPWMWWGALSLWSTTTWMGMLILSKKVTFRTFRKSRFEHFEKSRFEHLWYLYVICNHWSYSVYFYECNQIAIVDNSIVINSSTISYS